MSKIIAQRQPESFADGEQEVDEGTGSVELSVVMPCLNEAETVATCVQKAISFFLLHGVNGEVIVADNGSTDGRQSLAAAAAPGWSRLRNVATAAR